MSLIYKKFSSVKCEKVLWYPFYCQGYMILLPGRTPSTLTLCHQHFFQAWDVGDFFLFLFLPHLFFVTVFAISLTWTPPFPFILPLTGWNPAIFFHQLHKNLSRFPSSQLALIFSSFEPHCVLLYFLWHLTHSTSCYGCLILSMNCDLLEGKYNMLTSPDEVIVKLSSRFFYFPLDILLMSCIKRCI